MGQFQQNVSSIALLAEKIGRIPRGRTTSVIVDIMLCRVDVCRVQLSGDFGSLYDLASTGASVVTMPLIG